MANNKQKKTQDDFTSLILGIEPPVVPDKSKKPEASKNEVADTRVLDNNNDKTANISLIPTSEEVMPKKAIKNLETHSPASGQSFQFDSAMVSVEAALKQAELLKLTNKKNEDLEKKLSEISQENETLASSALVLQRKNDVLSEKNEELKNEMKSKLDLLKEEVAQKDKLIFEVKKELSKFQKKNEEASTLMNEKFQQARRREKELLNRLEILQSEEEVVLTTKDEKILQLKKEIDRMGFEIENYKQQLFELQSKLQAYKEQSRRSLKALKLASSLLEADENDPLKKTGT